MKVTLHLEGTRQEVITQMDEFRLVLSSSLESQPAKGAKGKGKKPAKAKEEEPEEEVEEEEIEEEEETEEEPEEEEEVEEEEIDDDEAEQEEETEEEDDSVPTIKVLTNALKKFSNRGEKQKNKAMMILKKYKIKHVDDLPKSKYKEVLKQLK